MEIIQLNRISCVLNKIYRNFLILPVSVENLIALITFQCFQILLTPRIFPVWDLVVDIFPRKAILVKIINEILITLINQSFSKTYFQKQC